MSKQQQPIIHTGNASTIKAAIVKLEPAKPTIVRVDNGNKT